MKSNEKLFQQIVLVALFPLFMVGGFPQMLTAHSYITPMLGTFAAIFLFVVMIITVRDWNKKSEGEQE